ncbi:hypothetical protein HanRHA438_Chr08g0371311 [Helianthus annuus]|nr:hypothetical protein HanRHA438_Chr08g0371311 [Helianthus annuus]
MMFTKSFSSISLLDLTFIAASGTCSFSFLTQLLASSDFSFGSASPASSFPLSVEGLVTLKMPLQSFVSRFISIGNACIFVAEKV